MLLNNIKKNRFAYYLIGPVFLFFLVFMVVPFFWNFINSFQEGSYLEPMKFVGLNNYIKLFGNTLFLKSILNTFKYLIIIVPSVFLFPMCIALVLNSIKKFQTLFRTLLFIPMLCSVVVSAIIWRYMTYPEYGPLSVIFNFLHIPNPNWFGNPKIVIFTIALVELWRGFPFYTVTFLAGLQSVPQELTEAGYIDGANYIQTLFRIVFPHMKPVLTFCLVMATIWNLQIFDSIYILTRGGPAEASSTMVWYIYNNVFFYNRVGRGATMSVVLIILIAIMTIINLKVTRFHEQVIY